MKCTRCDDLDCYRGKDCSTIHEASSAVMGEPSVERRMRIAAAIERDGYGELSRIQEVARYAHDMGYRRLGLAFCIGLAAEARLLAAYYAAEGFSVHSACCKIGGVSKADLGLARLHEDWDLEATCNPIGQAMELRRCRTDLNLAVGLCVGHDILFAQHSEAPVTTLVVKDRVHAHSPAAALYTGYGRSRLGI